MVPKVILDVLLGNLVEYCLLNHSLKDGIWIVNYTGTQSFINANYLTQRGIRSTGREGEATYTGTQSFIDENLLSQCGVCVGYCLLNPAMRVCKLYLYPKFYPTQWQEGYISWTIDMPVPKVFYTRSLIDLLNNFGYFYLILIRMVFFGT